MKIKNKCQGSTDKSMNRILCSIGAIIGRPNGRDITLLNKCLEQLECDGYEFLMYETWYEKEEEILGFLADFPAPLPVFHCEKGVGDLISRNLEGDFEQALELFEINCRMAKKIGSEKLVLHLWSGLDSDKDMPHNVEAYGILREISDKYGLALTVENVVCNRQDPMTHLITLAQTYPDIPFTFDTKMAEFHNQLDLLYREENARLLPNIVHMHINDYKGGFKEWKKLRTLHIGEGQIDFDRLFAFLKRIGYKGDFTVEATSFNESGEIDFEALNRSFRKIREYLE